MNNPRVSQALCGRYLSGNRQPMPLRGKFPTHQKDRPKQAARREEWATAGKLRCEEVGTDVARWRSAEQKRAAKRKADADAWIETVKARKAKR